MRRGSTPIAVTENLPIVFGSGNDLIAGSQGNGEQPWVWVLVKLVGVNLHGQRFAGKQLGKIADEELAIAERCVHRVDFLQLRNKIRGEKEIDERPIPNRRPQGGHVAEGRLAEISMADTRRQTRRSSGKHCHSGRGL